MNSEVEIRVGESVYLIEEINSTTRKEEIDFEEIQKENIKIFLLNINIALEPMSLEQNDQIDCLIEKNEKTSKAISY